MGGPSDTLLYGSYLNKSNFKAKNRVENGSKNVSKCDFGTLTTSPSKNDISDLGPLKLFMGVFRVSILTLRLIFVCAQNCKIAKLQNCNIAKLQNCKIAKLQNCKIAELQNCKMLFFNYNFHFEFFVLKYSSKFEDMRHEFIKSEIIVSNLFSSILFL